MTVAYRDRRTPWYAKVLMSIVIGYALSPIDLIPDFIPVLGLLDDLLLVPLGIYCCLKLIPDEVINEARARAAQTDLKKSYTGALVIAAIWIFLIIGLIRVIIGFGGK